MILPFDPLLPLLVLGRSPDELHRPVLFSLSCFYRFGGIATAIALKKQLGFDNFVVRFRLTFIPLVLIVCLKKKTRYMKSPVPLVGLGG